MDVVFIGAGNVATHLSLAMQKAGYTIVQVYSQTSASASSLANRLQTQWTTDIHAIVNTADYYIFSIKDNALQTVIDQMPANNGCWIHTAGSVPMELFKGYTKHYGVLYPLQTFSKTKELDFSIIPCFIEANTKENESVIYEIVSRLSNNVQVLNSEKRKYLHLAAVFACNFTNHMYTLANKILEEQGLSGEALLPLIDETSAKIHTISPAEAQTGPAIRYDQNIILKHLALLTQPEVKDIYQIISKNIHKEHTHE